MVLPLFAALVLAFIGLGKAVYYYLGVTHLAEEGVRLAVVSATIMPDGTAASSSSLADYLCSKVTSSDSAVDKATVAITYGGSGGSATAGNPVTVSVTTRYHLIPYFNAATIPINGSATMRLETPPAASGGTAFTGKSC
jgi:Flp pilus assembly protein TadG